MDKEKQHRAEDEDLFRQATRDVVPLKSSPRSATRAPRKSTRSRQRNDADRPTPAVGNPPAASADPAGLNDLSSWRRNGVQTSLLQKLKRGRFQPEDQLDLHHETAAVAHTMLQNFIVDAQQRRLRCIRIIHGKGLRSTAGPVLKRMVQQDLRENEGVLAFTSCKPADGGSGAVDVLLKTG